MFFLLWGGRGANKYFFNVVLLWCFCSYLFVKALILKDRGFVSPPGRGLELASARVFRVVSHLFGFVRSLSPVLIEIWHIFGPLRWPLLVNLWGWPGLS